MKAVQLRMARSQWAALQRHLFPGDEDEHGAVIAAAVLDTPGGIRLLAHRLFFAEDGVDYLPGQLGYRMLTADFVMDCALECAELKMAYLAVHCHGGTDTVGFSRTDMASHERGYPAIRDILNGPPAGGVVFAENAAAGDIWFADGQRSALDVLVVAGHPVQELRPNSATIAVAHDQRVDRQVRLLGDRGQQLLQRQKVGVIGAGGAGSIVIEQLAHLGVGEMVIVDPDRVDPTNLSRVVGSRRRDTRPLLTHPRLGPIGTFMTRFRRTKTAIAHRTVRAVNPDVKVTTYTADVTEPEPADALRDCDYLFLAADSMQARHVFNTLVHQYLIPGVQMGVKAQISKLDGSIVDLFVVSRIVVPGAGCLWCNGLILADQLQAEAIRPEQRRRQRYVDDADVPAPSVITLNGVAASLSSTTFLTAVTSLATADDELTWIRHDPRTNEFTAEEPRRDAACRQCGSDGLGLGTTRRLPVQLR